MDTSDQGAFRVSFSRVVGQTIGDERLGRIPGLDLLKSFMPDIMKIWIKHSSKVF
jgi:hypothetical protein